MFDITEIQLSEELGMYVDRLRAAYPSIDEVWLIGERANDLSAREASWKFLVFSGAEALEGLRRSAAEWRRPDVEFLIVTDGRRFESVWGPISGDLDVWQWRREDPNLATYCAPSADAAERAVRVR